MALNSVGVTSGGIENELSENNKEQIRVWLVYESIPIFNLSGFFIDCLMSGATSQGRAGYTFLYTGHERGR
jgi:hypothetical protein